MKIKNTIDYLASQPSLEPHPGITAKWALDQGYTLETLSSSNSTNFTDDTKDVWTDVGGSVVFADKFKKGLKEDILYSWEYAQRWANKQIHDKYGMTDTRPGFKKADTIYTHTIEWYGYFMSMLGKLHWITKDFNFDNAGDYGSTFTVDKIILDVLASFLGDDEISKTAITEAIGVLKGLGGDSPKMVLWDSHTNSSGKGTFQMGAVRDGGNGIATLRTGALEIDSSTTTTECFFFFNYSSSDTTVNKACQDLIFNQNAYTTKDDQGNSAKSIVKKAVVNTTNQFLNNDGGIE